MNVWWQLALLSLVWLVLRFVRTCSPESPPNQLKILWRVCSPKDEVRKSIWRGSIGRAR